MNTIPGFAHSVFVLILVGSASALLISAASALITTRESIIAHLGREQATLDAYTCITAALRTATDYDGLFTTTSPLLILLPFAIYHPERKLCSITHIEPNTNSVVFMITVAPETLKRAMEIRVPIHNSRITGPPAIRFMDE